MTLRELIDTLPGDTMRGAARRALMALRLEVPQMVADDVSDYVEAAFAADDALLDEVRECLKSVEWQEIGRLYDGCRFCGQERPDGHTPDCRLSALLSRLKRAGLPDPPRRHARGTALGAARAGRMNAPGSCYSCGAQGLRQALEDKGRGVTYYRCAQCGWWVEVDAQGRVQWHTNLETIGGGDDGAGDAAAG